MPQIDPTVPSSRNCSQQDPNLWEEINTVQIPMKQSEMGGQDHARKTEVGVFLIFGPGTH